MLLGAATGNRRYRDFMARVRGAALGVFAVLALAALVAGRAAATGGALPRDLTIFTVASDVQFINTADPGDVVVFNFNLYGKLPVKKKIGSASYTCYFNYRRHALCQAYYQLHGGTLTAAGPVDFNATSFKLVVTGGTNGYLAARGQVTSVKSKDNAQRVDFRLLG